MTYGSCGAWPGRSRRVDSGVEGSDDPPDPRHPRHRTMRLKLQIAAFVLIALAITAVFMAPPEETVGLKADIREKLAPTFKWFSGLQSRAGDVREKLKRAERLEHENEDLRKANAKLLAENNTLRSFEKENAELRQALKYREISRFELVPARVIAREPSTWWQYVTIDRGQRDGVELNQAVVSTRGLVGKIASVSATTSKVVLLGDENCRVAATLEGTNEQGIIIGQPTEMGAVQCRMTFISRTASIDVGQLAFTSGLGGVFPQGLRIGEVSQLVPLRDTGGHGLYREVIVQPSADLSKLDFLFVVLRQRETKAATPPTNVQQPPAAKQAH